MMTSFVRIFLLAHGLLTLAAALVLIVTPTWIPAAVHIRLQPDQYLMSYFLAAAELAIAWLSFYAVRIRNAAALKGILYSFMIFHGSTAILEVYACLQGADPAILVNMGMRLLIIGLIWYGLHQMAGRKKNRNNRED
ncbi:hypothetical protein GCM10027051_17590 [Niabella terrae]